jgi:hypothetical protein
MLWATDFYLMLVKAIDRKSIEVPIAPLGFRASIALNPSFLGEALQPFSCDSTVLNSCLKFEPPRLKAHVSLRLLHTSESPLFK